MEQRFVLLLVCLWSFMAVAEPVAWDGTAKSWLTRGSEHFQIHYPQGEQYEETALHALDLAETVHKQLIPFFGTVPATKTQLVLVDDFDISNGWATFSPFPQIRLFSSPPQDINGLENNDEWMAALIRHEYVHILHMEMARGIPANGRKVFGRLPFFFPHALTPPLFIEGLAVYFETNPTLGIGRLQSNFYEMQMRAEVRSGEFDELGEAVASLREWPYGKHYLYGAYFIDYLVRTYGEQQLQRYLQQYSKQILPYIMQNDVARTVFGKNFAQLWDDFRKDMLVRFAADPEQTYVEGRSIADSGFRTLATTVLGDRLFVNYANDQDRAELRVYPTDSSNAQAADGDFLTYTKGITDLDVNAEGVIAASRRLSYSSGRLENDIFIWQNNDWTRLTSEQRLRKVRWLPKGERLVASRMVAGISELYLLTLNGEMSLLWRGVAGDVLGDFDVSPDGLSIAASIKRPDQGWNLELFSIADHVWTPLTNSLSIESAPEYTPDGSLLFTADYDGVFNIYLRTSEGDVSQITQVESGAFSPRWRDGSVVYQQYTVTGYQLREIPMLSALPPALTVTDVPIGMHNYPNPVLISANSSVAEPYSPLKTVRPYYWLPAWEITDTNSRVGLQTGGMDALGRHMYSLLLLRDVKQDVWEGSAFYSYDPRWTLSWDRSHSYRFPFSEVLDPIVIRDDTVRGERNYLLRGIEDQLSLSAGLSYSNKSLVRAPEEITIVGPRDLSQGLAGLALTFDNRETYLQSTGVGWGHKIEIVAETNDLLESAYKGEQYQADWQYSFNIAGRHSLTLSAAGGWADDTAGTFILGGLPPQEDLQRFGRDELSLSGYQQGAAIGHFYDRERIKFSAWLGRIEDNWDVWPIGAGDVSLSLYAESGAAWFRGQDRKVLPAVGMELSIEALIGYRLILPIKAGVAYGIDDTLGETQTYLRTAWYY
ncbi:hypothetical protein [Thalassolituus oleivorans]|uniref:hypothetical protein n=1 Tax=Thalassolituus oleivorans TaxID=187493 RepID=UPI001CE34A17|nr:hypothetical protein [Thalassolituus oleivorans]MCA6129119.1 hypothetical protein [Thalassolituus oleivorans 4BN06-13]